MNDHPRTLLLLIILMPLFLIIFLGQQLTNVAKVQAVHEAQVDYDAVDSGVVDNIPQGDLADDPRAIAIITSDLEGLARLQLDTNLVITKTASHDPVSPGEVLTYTLVVENKGPDDATNVVVTDTLPANGIIYNSASAGCSEDSLTVACPIGNQIIGASNIITISVSVNQGVSGTLVNSAEVGSDNPDTTGPNSSSVNTAIEAIADLSLTKSVDDTTPNVGDNVRFTVRVDNDGPSDATGVTVVDLLPTGYNNISSSGGTYDIGTGLWTIGPLPAASFVELTITATVQASGVYTNVAQVAASDQTDPDSQPNNDTGNQSQDDEDSVIVTPTAIADLTIAKTDSQDPATAGTVLTYTLTITNSGPSNAVNVVVTDTLPSGVTYASASTGCSHDSGVVTCGLGSLVNAATKVITVAVTINQGTTIPLNNLAQVGSDSPDSTGPNSTSEITAIVAQADLTIAKTDSQDPVAPGETLTYTLTITNSGPSNAVNVVVTDTLPAGVTYASASTGCSSALGEVSCILGSLNVDVTQIITVAVTINQGTTIPLTNLAQVASDTPDSTGPNSTSESTAIAAEADLTISKTDSQDPATAGTVLTYTLTITNSGPSNAVNVVVTDTLPGGVTYASASTGCSSALGEVSCILGSLNVDVTQIITVAVTVNQGTTIPLTNLAQVASDTPDSTGPNSTSEITAIAAEADLTIAKTDSQDPATAGTVLTYTLTITNSGPSNAANVMVTDTLPSGVTYHSASSDCSLGSGVVSCGLDSSPQRGNESNNHRRHHQPGDNQHFE